MPRCHRPKYLHLSSKAKDDKPVALVSTKDTLYNLPALVDGGEILYVVEGPFDALKIDCYGRENGVRAVCLFGKHATAHQLELLSIALSAFDRVTILLDNDAIAEAQDIAQTLSDQHASNKIRLGHLPNAVKDPGDLTMEQVRGMRDW